MENKVLKKPVVAVVGGRGFVGAEVVRALRGDGMLVRGAAIGKRIDWHVADLECEWIYEKPEEEGALDALLEGVDGLIHCGGYRPRWGEGVDQGKARGVKDLRRVLDSCERYGVRKVVYLSSASTVQEQAPGETPGRVSDESSYYIPGSSTSPFAEVKAAMEAEVYRYVSSGLPVTIVNPGFVLGPGDVHLENQVFLAHLVQKTGALIPRGSTNVVDVRDLAGGIVGALKMGRPGRRYLLGGEEVELEDLLKQCAQLLDRECSCRVLDPTIYERVIDLTRTRAVQWIRKGICLEAKRLEGSWVEMARWSASIQSDRAVAELGYRTRSLESTLMDTVTWARRVGYLS